MAWLREVKRIFWSKSLTKVYKYGILSSSKLQGQSYEHPGFPGNILLAEINQNAHMYFSQKKAQKKHLQKSIIATIVFGLLSFHVSLAYAGQDPYAVPANWPSDWVAPFADEAKVEAPAPVVPERKVKFTKTVAATAYSSDVHQTDAYPFRPAMAMDFREEVALKGEVNCIAHNDLRLGTDVSFPELFGKKVFKVCDRMNERYTGKNRVDFYFYVIGPDGKIDTKESLNAARNNAKAFGLKRFVKMEILEKLTA